MKPKQSAPSTHLEAASQRPDSGASQALLGPLARSLRTRSKLCLLAGASFVTSLACSEADPGTGSSSGGAMGSGGASAASGGQAMQGGSTGGPSGAGGATQSAGGAIGLGGATGNGGLLGAGGAVVPTTGGTAGGGGSSGGSATLGGNGSGGSAGAGGSTAGANSGGSVAAGGTASGGTSAQGGAGGSSSKGGAAGSGGTLSKGGSTGAGGAVAGQSSSGGKASMGGSTSVGGSAGLCPDGVTRTITVAKTGGDFNTVQAAIDSIPSGSTTPVRIDIRAGTYTEKLTIASRTNLCLVGEAAASTILTYGDNNTSAGSTSGSASVHVSANDFSAANLTIQNSYGTGSQAVALRTTGQRQQFLNCRFVGYQDTLYTHSGSQYFRNCYVQGNTDYVFGGATAVLQNCEVRNVEGGSAVTAPSTEAALAYGIVFLGGRFTAASSVSANSVGLGRPWRPDGAAAFLNVELGAHVKAEGFVPMSDNVPENARFKEYQSTGPGGNASARTRYQLTSTDAARYTLANILGTWTPSYSR